MVCKIWGLQILFQKLFNRNYLEEMLLVIFLSIIIFDDNSNPLPPFLSVPSDCNNSNSCNLYSGLILRQCSDSTSLLQPYSEAIPHSEEGIFQTQPPSQQYYYRYLYDHAKTATSMKLCIVNLCVWLCIWYPGYFLVRAGLYLKTYPRVGVCLTIYLHLIKIYVQQTVVFESIIKNNMDNCLWLVCNGSTWVKRLSVCPLFSVKRLASWQGLRVKGFLATGSKLYIMGNLWANMASSEVVTLCDIIKLGRRVKLNRSQAFNVHKLLTIRYLQPVRDASF